MAKVLYISYDGMTDPLGQSQVLPYLVELSKAGHDITILSCEKPYNFRNNRSQIERIAQEAQLRWHPIKYRKRPPILSTVIDIFSMYLTARGLHKRSSFDIVHCRSYISALIGLKLKNKYGLRFLFDIRGFWIDERIEGGMWNKDKLIYRTVIDFFRKKEKDFYHQADAIVSLTQKGKEQLAKWPGLDKKDLPVEVIPCCVDLSLFNPNNINKEEALQLRDSLFKDEHLIISYVGSLGTWYMLEEMLRFFQKISELKNNVRFLIITKDDPTVIFDQAEKMNIPRDYIKVKSSDRGMMPYYIHISDISLYFIRPTFSKIASSPTKQAEIMAMGVPIITNAGIGDSDYILGELKNGFILKSFDFKDVHHLVDNIDFFLQSFSKNNAIEQAEKYYSLSKGVDHYNSIYKRLV